MTRTQQNGAAEHDCRCEPTWEDGTLVLVAEECPGEGDLALAPACRAAAVRALADRACEDVRTRRRGRERVYLDGATALLRAAAAFAVRLLDAEDRLAALARHDPVAAAAEVRGRTGPAATAATETGLLDAAPEREEDVTGDRESAVVYPAAVGPTVSHTRVRLAPPLEATLVDATSLSTGSTLRRYALPGSEQGLCHLVPATQELSTSGTAALDRARALVASGAVSGADPVRRAVDRVCSADSVEDDREILGRILSKHLGGCGALADLFAAPSVTDVFANAPVADGPLHLVADGDRYRTNVRLTESGGRALASTLRRESGRAFSRASPRLDATLSVGDRQVRVAGTRRPVSDGLAFAFRAHDDERWTLQRLVRTGTMTPAVAGLLAATVSRGGTILVAGPRGSGKTTLLGALLWALPPAVRLVAIEDTQELPIDALREAGRNVQGLLAARRTDRGLSPTEALRTALRLGDGALAVGEVRGAEAAVLYEAMRVGAGDETVLGTIHGEDARSVRERLVSDLGVPASSVAETDLVVALETVDRGGKRQRRVATVAEARRRDDDVAFTHLFDRTDGELRPTGPIRRGNSTLVSTLAESDESYATVLDAIGKRVGEFDATAPGVDDAVATWPCASVPDGAQLSGSVRGS